MSRSKNMRRISVKVTPQTLYNLDRLAAMDGCKHIGKVIDKLTRDRMMELRRTGRQEKRNGKNLDQYGTEELVHELWQRA